MSGSEMKEAQSGVAVLEEVESDTITACCEYAYTNDYRLPTASRFRPKSCSGIDLAGRRGSSRKLALRRQRNQENLIRFVVHTS